MSVYEKGNKPWGGVVGEETVKVNVTAPPHQSRAISESVFFKDMPKLEPNRWTWGYFITEIRGSKGYDWFEANAPIGKDFDPDKYLGLTPTPSPKP